MLRVVCPTCGTEASFEGGGSIGSVCAECGDLLPKAKPTNPQFPDWFDITQISIEAPRTRRASKKSLSWIWAFAVIPCAAGTLLAIVIFAAAFLGRPTPPRPTLAPVPEIPTARPIVLKSLPQIDRFKSTTFAVYAESRIGDTVEIRGWATAALPDNLYPSGVVRFVSFGINVIICEIAPGKERTLAFWSNPRQERIAIVRGRCVQVDSDGIIYLDRAEVLPAD
jgi:hypothetical protein